MHNPKGFVIKGIHAYNKDEYDTNGFDIKGIHKYTGYRYDTNGFDINKKHKKKLIINMILIVLI